MQKSPKLSSKKKSIRLRINLRPLWPQFHRGFGIPYGNSPHKGGSLTVQKCCSTTKASHMQSISGSFSWETKSLDIAQRRSTRRAFHFMEFRNRKKIFLESNSKRQRLTEKDGKRLPQCQRDVQFFFDSSSCHEGIEERQTISP